MAEDNKPDVVIEEMSAFVNNDNAQPRLVKNKRSIVHPFSQRKCEHLVYFSSISAFAFLCLVFIFSSELLGYFFNLLLE